MEEGTIPPPKVWFEFLQAPSFFGSDRQSTILQVRFSVCTVPDIDPGVTYEATEQREFELASEMVRLEISDNSRQSHANVPIRKIDLASLDLLTGDSVMVGIKKTA